MRGWREEGREEGMGRDGGVLRGLWEKKRSEASEEEESPSVRPSACATVSSSAPPSSLFMTETLPAVLPLDLKRAGFVSRTTAATSPPLLPLPTFQLVVPFHAAAAT